MQKKKRITIKVITTAAMLAALSVLIGIFCKTFLQHPALVYYRITFENLPVILSGLLFGPIVGAMVGVCADIVSCLCSPNPAVNPLISLGAAMVGVMAGVTPYIIRKKGALQTAVAVATAHLVGQVFVKSIAKMIFFSMPWHGIFVGIGVSLAVGVLEFAAISLLRSSRGISRFLEGE